MVGISANCKNKEAALKYVKMLLGEEVQKNGFMSLPVNRNAWRDREKTLPEHLWAELNRIISGISSAGLEDTVANAIVKEEAGRLAGGKLSLDQAVAWITERIGALQAEADIEKGNILKAAERNGAEDGLKMVEKKELKIYLMDYNKNAMNAVEEYNRGNDNSVIRVTAFEDRDEYRKRLSTEILAGEGPDIVLFNDRDLPTIRKMINSGVFCDMEAFIRNDSEFDYSELNRKVFDCGVLNGKRYVVPLEYNLSTLYTTPGISKSGNISLEGGDWSWDGIRSITNGYSDMEKNKYFLTSLQLKEVIIGSGLKLIDYEKRQVFFNSPDFVRLLKVYREICNNCCMPEEIQERYGQDDISLMKNGKLSMGKDSNILNPENLLFTNSIALQDLGEALELFRMPSLNKDSAAAAYPSCLAGINSNSGSKEA